MNAVRRFLLRHRALAGWIFAAALVMKILVPAGFMPMMSGDTVIIQICSGYGPQSMTMQMEMPGKAGHSDSDSHSKAETPCAFSGLAAPSLAAADPILLALAILFVFATVLRASAQIPAAAARHLRPPLRGPPVHS